MEAFAIVALVGFVLLAIEMLLPTGGILAAIGVAGLVAAGIIALDSDNSSGDVIGGALIALGIVSAVCFYFITRKVIAAHRDQPVQTGTEEMIGSQAEARSSIDPEGQVWFQGTTWSARLADGGAPIGLGDRVTVEAVDGLTLVVRGEPQIAERSKQGVS